MQNALAKVFTLFLLFHPQETEVTGLMAEEVFELILLAKWSDTT